MHYSHYGRMCPIETPEGPNIGLISYLATFAKINEYGFVEAPYRKVDKEKGVVTDEVVYMTADVEDEYVVAQANEPLDAEGHFMKARVNARRRDEILEIEREKVDYMDVSPKMVVSVATAMIPFGKRRCQPRPDGLQHAAAGRTPDGYPAAHCGHRHGIQGRLRLGRVHPGEKRRHRGGVDADKIVVRTGKTTTDEYELIKFMRSNQGTCINQRPIVNKGYEVKRAR